MKRKITLRLLFAIVFLVVALLICLWKELWWMLLMYFLVTWAGNLFNEEAKAANEQTKPNE